MNARRLVREFFPPPRRRVRWRDAIPLIVFLVAYAATCIALEMSDTLLFARPSAFVLILFAGWVWWLHVAGYAGLPPMRALVALATRFVLVGTFVMLMAEPRAVRTRDVLSVVYAIDVSDSIGERSTDAALEFMTATVQGRPEKDEAGLVVFGTNAAVELPPRSSFPFEGDVNSRIQRDATNLEKALRLAATILPEQNLGRIVLISDGTETAGNLTSVIDELRSRDISVDVLPIQYEYDQEVWLERLDLPQFVKTGETYEALIVLSSLKAGQGNLVLRENGKVIGEQDVTFEPGKNRYIVPIYLREPGFYEYSATIELDRNADNLRENNTVLNYLYIEGEGRVLIVTDPQGDPRDWETLDRTIRQGERLVEIQSAYDFPRDALPLMPYDCIVFANVPADAVDAVQMQALSDAVTNLGVGFLMVGGQNSFGPGGYHRTPIEEVLPVSMDVTKKRVLPKGALVVILHTCEFNEGNTWAKRITKQAIKVLSAQDDVGAIGYVFDGGEKWIFELTPAGDYDQLVPLINAAQIGDMPAFGPTMQLGFNGLVKNDAATKHMIIISDGDPQPPAPALLKSFVTNNISISTVGINPHGPGDVAVLRMIANTTGGNFYFPADPNLLPAIFIKEAKTLSRSMIQNKTVVPEVALDSAILKGIDAIPPLHGYVLTTAKDSAETILQVTQESVEGGLDIDPILAKWRKGLGATAAFTSDLSPNWGKEWVAWDKFPAIIKQLMIEISRTRTDGHLRMWTDTTGSEGVITVEDYHPDHQFLDVTAAISHPELPTERIQLKQTGPRRYQGTVPLSVKGRYQVNVEGKAGDRKDTAQGGFIVPYSPEYLRFRSNPIVLSELQEKTKGRMLSKSSTAHDIYETRRKPKQSSSPVFDWFLIALACLLPLDVAVRRIQLDPYVMLNWLRRCREAGPSTDTMGELLERKQAVDSALDIKREPRPSDPRPKTTSPSQPIKSRETPPPKPASESTPSQADRQTTTERLLDLKRKRKEQDK